MFQHEPDGRYVIVASFPANTMSVMAMAVNSENKSEDIKLQIRILEIFRITEPDNESSF